MERQDHSFEHRPLQQSARSAAAVKPSNPRLRAMLDGPIVPTVFGLAWPNILMMLAQSSTGIVETGFIARLGTESLAGMALVVPLLMLMQNMSQGAMGGGISSAIARALGEGKRAEADDYVLHALVLNIALGALFSIAILIAAPWLYPLLGGHGQSLAVALTYSNIVFGGIVLMWIMNAFASAIRGTGNMLVPGLVICGGAALLIPLSAALIFGYGPIPRLGIVGAGIAMLAYYGAGSLILGWYCASARNPARLRFCKLRYSLFRRILSVGGLATINSLQTNVMIALSIAVVGSHAGTAAVAEDVLEVSPRIMAIELGRLHQAHDDGGTLPSEFASTEEPRFSAHGNHEVILPMSGKRSKSSTVGMRCTAVVCGVSTASNERRASAACGDALLRTLWPPPDGGVYGPRGWSTRVSMRPPQRAVALPQCFAFGGRRPDEAIARELLRAVEPLAVEAALQAERRHMEVQSDQRRIVDLELQQARYEASLAERRYAACDPDNRLIAAQLEKSWESALQPAAMRLGSVPITLS